MNDSTRGAPPPGTGYWSPADQGPVPAAGGGAVPPSGTPRHGTEDGSARRDREVPEAAQTRPMPIVPDDAAPGGGQEGRPDGDPGGRSPDGPERGRPDQHDTTPPHGDPLRRPAPPGPDAGADAYGDSGAPRESREPRETRTGGADPATGESRAGGGGRKKRREGKRAGRDLRAAIGVGLGLGAVIIASLFVYKHLFVGVIALAVVVGLWELTSRLAERKGIRAPLVPLAAGGAAMVIAGYVEGAEGAWVAMAFTALAVLAWRMTESPEEYLRDVTAAVFAAFYVPFLATFVALLLAADDGPWRVLTFLLLTVVSDTGAYAVGWRFGRRKLAPRISPGKTREGLVGAVTFAMAAGALCMEFAIDGGSWWQGLLLGLAVAISATLGDLGESMIKRDLGIKDMGTLLPGHGGIMDRLDSLLPTAPVVWLLLVVFVGTG
ncbi:phosphatidate cytidylyltransferase [Streptomyces sp. JJ36]|uniref:phosphatidate cytidylyltransferase n=1 Tax=Streptomyces sp. JJ36 TaxID=2736645 RepID=UPI001F2F1731|nr:phosphatidate cytidylyltransferase [Streptomyces sp. JJ36]MCF6523264.1 phosphatidate cytidylyltransferase [Streptomyces sp. JJ36]